MTSGGIEMGMTPPHPGAFIRIEAIDAGAGRRDRRSAVSAGMIVALREIFFIAAKRGHSVPGRACCGQVVDSMQEIP